MDRTNVWQKTNPRLPKDITKCKAKKLWGKNKCKAKDVCKCKAKNKSKAKMRRGVVKVIIQI